MLGPVQVLIVGVADPESARSVLGSIVALAPDGPVRCVDAFECIVHDDGELTITTPDGRPPPSLPLFAEESDELVPVFGAEETWHLGEVVPPGGHAVVALLEHRWAEGIRGALLAEGATLRHEAWLDAEDRSSLESFLSQASALAIEGEAGTARPA
jgi:hypothetical protein